MEITAIEPRRKSLEQLYIDGEPAVKLDRFLLVKRGIKAGMEITDEELQELIAASDERRAREKALYLLEYRAHSKKELIDKIARTTSTREAAEKAAEKMQEIGLIDDRAYAEAFAKTLIKRKKYGLWRVKQELRMKGISSEITEDILLDYEDEDYTETISAFLLKKYPEYAEDEGEKRRAVAALQRRGYGYDQIRSAMQAIRDKEDFEDYDSDEDYYSDTP